MEKFMTTNKKYMAIILTLIIVLGSAFAVYSMEHPKLSNTDFIRLHVLANSDTYEDQTLKLKVRDEVLALMAPKMKELYGETGDGSLSHPNRQDREPSPVSPENRGNTGTAAIYIKDHFEEIKEKALEVIRQNGYDYDVSVSLKPTWIPEKAYDHVIFPEGEYLALNVVIGEGKGSNWWCVLFPPLCLIDTAPEANAIASDDTKIKIKFKSVELLEKIGGSNEDESKAK